MKTRTINRLRLRAVQRRLRRGVTLVEVLIVVAIMALIAGGVGFLAIPRYRKAQIETATTQARSIRGVATNYFALESNGECPTVEQLVAGKHLDPDNEKDPWGQRFGIACEGDDISVWSFGPDKQENTEDDIVVPKRTGGENT
jgi:general secretion pathway protein G